MKKTTLTLRTEGTIVAVSAIAAAITRGRLAGYHRHRHLHLHIHIHSHLPRLHCHLLPTPAPYTLSLCPARLAATAVPRHLRPDCNWRIYWD